LPFFILFNIKWRGAKDWRHLLPQNATYYEAWLSAGDAESALAAALQSGSWKAAKLVARFLKVF